MEVSIMFFDSLCIYILTYWRTTWLYYYGSDLIGAWRVLDPSPYRKKKIIRRDNSKFSCSFSYKCIMRVLHWAIKLQQWTFAVCIAGSDDLSDNCSTFVNVFCFWTIRDRRSMINRYLLNIFFRIITVLFIIWCSN